MAKKKRKVNKVSKTIGHLDESIQRNELPKDVLTKNPEDFLSLLITGEFKGRYKIDEINQSLVKIIAEAAVDFWKILQRIESLKEKMDVSPYQSLKRPVESALLRLQEAGVEIKERTGEFYDYGMDELVLATEERAGSNRDVIAETIKPAIYYKHQIISRGEIIVGTPVKVNQETQIEEENK